MKATDVSDVCKDAMIDKENLRNVIAEHGLLEAVSRVKSFAEAASEKMKADHEKLKVAF